jgi:hypothetical protein
MEIPPKTQISMFAIAGLRDARKVEDRTDAKGTVTDTFRHKYPDLHEIKNTVV